MQTNVKLVLDIPYALFREKYAEMTADDRTHMITEAIPKRACEELEIIREKVWKKIGWKHANLKFFFFGIEEEFVFDQEKKHVAAIYFSRADTGEPLNHDVHSIAFTDEGDLAALMEEVANRAAKAGLI